MSDEIPTTLCIINAPGRKGRCVNVVLTTVSDLTWNSFQRGRTLREHKNFVMYTATYMGEDLGMCFVNCAEVDGRHLTTRGKVCIKEHKSKTAAQKEYNILRSLEYVLYGGGRKYHKVLVQGPGTLLSWQYQFV